MATVMYGCGCGISRSMFGDGAVMGAWLCWQHQHLYSQDKTMREMAAEIAGLDHCWRESPPLPQMESTL